MLIARRPEDSDISDSVVGAAPVSLVGRVASKALVLG
jgi:hypothetical protein